jgi:GT2 family glycosyltransferase
MKTLIVIVNYNGAALLKKNLSSLIKFSGDNTDICVVDNASSDNSISFLKKKYPDVKIVSSKTNLGYGGGCNLGFEKYPNYNYYVFMNNDISVKGKWIDQLIEVFNKKENVGAVGPKMLYFKQLDGKYIVNSTGLEITDHYIAYDRNDGEVDSVKYNKVEKVDGLCGAVLMISKEVFERVGGFHEDMFLYYEDVDLSFRIRDEGYSIYYCGKSVVYHDHMATTESLGNFKRNWMNMKNRSISIKRRLGPFIALRETIWYLYSWSVWKTFSSKNITLKENLDDK